MITTVIVTIGKEFKKITTESISYEDINTLYAMVKGGLVDNVTILLSRNE